MDHERLERGARLALTAALGAYALVLLRAGEPGTIPAALDLAIHETGHLVFAPFGETPAILGGTLLQLLVPLAFLVAFLRRGDRHAASVMCWWVGQNGWHIAPYVADARAQALPLVGGGEHDWYLLLARWDLLEQDEAIGRAVRLLGTALVGWSVVWGVLSVAGRPGSPPSRPARSP